MVLTMTNVLTRTVLSFLLAGSLLCVPGGEAFCQGAMDAASGEQAEVLFQKGKELFSSGRTQQAYDALTKAWSLRKSHDIAANLGTVELELRMVRDAAEHLAYAIRVFPTTGSKAQLTHVKDLFNEARNQVGALSIRVNVDAAEVFVDGKSVGRAPLAEQVYVGPGARTVEARMVGYASAKQSIQVARGATAQLSMALTPSELAQPTSVRPSTAVLAAGGSLAGLGVLLGAVFTVVSNNKASDAAATRAGLVRVGGVGACGTASSAGTCADLHGLLQDRANFGDAAIWSFVAAGASGVGTAVYWLVAPASASKADVGATVVVAPHSAGFAVQGTW